MISGETNNIPEIDLHLTSVPVVGGTRKLKTRFTYEMIQDILACHPLDTDNPNHPNHLIYLGIIQNEMIRRRMDSDRRRYLTLIEEWCGVKINKKLL